jgi:hypothetical protein
LQANNVRIPKIHHLLEIPALILKFDTSYEFLRTDLETLEDYAVHFRYPGEFAEKGQAQAAYQAAKVVREFVQQKLGMI